MSDPRITHEAVEAAARALAEQFVRNASVGGSKDFTIDARAALEAALPYLQAQPVASRERVAEVLREAGEIHPHIILSGWFGHAANALLAAGVFREPQPVAREALAKALHDAACGCDHYGHMVEIDDRDAADVVLALIGGEAK